MTQEIRGDLENTRCPEIIKIISLGRRTGRLAFATPILSTVLLLVTPGQPLQWNVAVAAVLVVGAALWGSR